MDCCTQNVILSAIGRRIWRFRNLGAFDLGSYIQSHAEASLDLALPYGS